MEKNRSDTTREFTLKSLQDITNNFSREHIIGSGGYGVVYKGVLENGEEIAIKKLHYMPGLDDTQFRNEFNNLMRVQHRNITRLVGYCYHLGHERIMYNGEYVFAHVEERVLCFEYLPGGSLDKYISDESCGLDWNMRHKIIKGVCEGLNYLHNGYKDPIYHLDLKPANILLDKYMMPKIGDFGLSRLFPSAHTYTTIKIIGTPGYMPPEYIEKYEITSKFDVFSLGVIIIRIIAGDEGYSKRANMSSQEFVEHVHENWRRRLLEIMPLYTSQQVMTCIEIALRCVETDRVRRPTISEIVMELNKIDTFKSSAIRELSAFWRQWLDVEDTDDDHGFEYTDDEPVVAPPHSDTRVQLMIKEYINKVPLDETKKTVMLELTGSGSAGDRLGLDVVVILDMSGSIQGEKIQEMKTAMKFIIDKLSPIDRLSIVTLSTAVHRLCPLRRITKTCQSELQGLIDGLIAGGNVANISDGLQTGLKVLADRKINRDRIVGVMIMSNGLLTNRGNQVADRHGNVVPVYTFGFGADHGPMVFHEIINQRKGPSFSTATQEMDSLRLALSRCLDSLLTIVVQDLSLTVACIEKESAMLVKVMTDGRHQQTQDAPHGSVTVSIGNVSSREVCKLTVYLLLSAIKSKRSMDILKITYSYSTSGELFVAPPLTLTLWCTDTGMAVLEKEKRPEAPREEICVQQMVKKTSTKAATSSSDLCYSCPQRPPARTRADHDYFVKLLLVGSYSAGKSKLLLRFTDGSFTTSYISTMGIDSKTRTVELDGKRIKVLVWVTAEQEFLRDISTAYYRGAMGILLVYDVTDELSFNSIRSVYHRNIEELAPVGVNKILVGNKTDMDESRWAVPTSRGQALADKYGIRFFETSAKTNMNVEEAFFSLVRDIMHSYHQKLTTFPWIRQSRLRLRNEDT